MGLWLPLVTPFRNGELDDDTQSAAACRGTTPAGPVDGLILAATSGEGMTLGATAELERLVGIVTRQPK